MRLPDRVGARFDDRVTGNLATFAPHAKIIHIDIDPSSISKNVDVDVPVVGDAGSLEAMLPHIEHRDRASGGRRSTRGKSAIRSSIWTIRKNAKPQYVIEEINRQTAAMRSSPPAWASIRCGRRSFTAGAIPAR
jgi:acetolactate synthase-1/2/3 large subunit